MTTSSRRAKSLIARPRISSLLPSASRPVRPSLVYFIAYPSQLRASCKVRDDIRREEFVSLDVVPVIAVDQQVHTGVLILADQIDGLGHYAHKTPQRSALSQPLTLRRHSGLVAAEHRSRDQPLGAVDPGSRPRRAEARRPGGQPPLRAGAWRVPAAGSS